MKRRVTRQPLLALPYFSNVFQVYCNASGTIIVVVLTQEGKPIAFFSKKLNEAKKK